ncbi:MAG: Txe/YoeB family addiction module toxin [Candidatus Ancillula sp.]|jgi:Txe/YoeB family toxin of toxin-antitoxin system|nr:Txe/YoeB family addiction module toxin [Candidatus Ancillula sp.]
MYELKFTKLAAKHATLLKSAGQKEKTMELLNIIRDDPYQTTPSYKKLSGNLSGLYSRRINVKHRLAYEIKSDYIKIIRMWGHYYDN